MTSATIKLLFDIVEFIPSYTNILSEITSVQIVIIVQVRKERKQKVRTNRKKMKRQHCECKKFGCDCSHKFLPAQ